MSFFCIKDSPLNFFRSVAGAPATEPPPMLPGEGEAIVARAPQGARAKSRMEPCEGLGVWRFYNRSGRTQSRTRTQHGELRVYAVRLRVPWVERERLAAALCGGLDISKPEQRACKPCGRIGDRGREVPGPREHIPRLRPRTAIEEDGPEGEEPRRAVGRRLDRLPRERQPRVGFADCIPR